MITPREILLALLLPFTIAALLAVIAAWRRWAWLIPAAAGFAFFVGYFWVNWPHSRQLPPSQGSDWLMWVGLAATIAGVAATLARPAWLAPSLGAVAGLAAFIIARPLTPHAVTAQTLWTTTLLVALTGAAVVAALSWTATRVPPPWLIAATATTIAAAGVLSMASGFRTLGVYALAASIPLAPLILAAFRFKTYDPTDTRPARTARGVAVYSITVLAGVLTAARFYPDPGVTPTTFTLLLLAPALTTLGALAPIRSPWLKGLLALTAVSTLAAALAGPPALRAKNAAENPDAANPYSSEYP